MRIWYVSLGFKSSRDGANVESQKLYLIGSLERVISGHRKSPSLLSVHIRVLGHGAGGSRIVEKARKYTSRCPQAANVWLERLAMEKQHGSRESVEKAWEEARRSVAGSEDEIASVWQWGLENCGAISMEHLAQLHEASSDCMEVAICRTILTEVHYRAWLRRAWAWAYLPCTR